MEASASAENIGFLSQFLLLLGSPVAVIVAVIAGFILASFRSNQSQRNIGDIPTMASEQRPPSDNDCPICMDTRKFAVETNCGHSFCANCLIVNWRTNYPTSVMSCPFCRQDVTLLLPCFTDGERYSAELEEVQERQRVSNEIKTYNRMYSDHPRSFWGQLLDLPTMLRHIWGELFTERGFEMISKFRVILCVVIGIIYAIMPIDLIPEAFLGLLGLIDDVFVIAFLLVQVSVVYRSVIANRDF